MRDSYHITIVNLVAMHLFLNSKTTTNRYAEELYIVWLTETIKSNSNITPIEVMSCTV